MRHSISRKHGLFLRTISVAGLTGLAAPALAHHAMEGRTAESSLEGLLSGLAHPVIGLDHLAFMIAISLLAVGLSRRNTVPLAFVLTTVLGAVIHFMGIQLPLAEVAVALSVVGAGALLLVDKSYRQNSLVVLGAAAGLFHGYAYGESIVGAEQTPLLAYLVGFSCIQFALMAAAIRLGDWVLKRPNQAGNRILARSTGSIVSLTGLVFLSFAILAV